MVWTNARPGTGAGGGCGTDGADNLAPHAPGFEFRHHDVFELGFNPGAEKARWLPFPAEDDAFSLAIAWSVFTHVNEDQAVRYLHEMRRILRSDGLLLSTWFLFDKTEFPMMQDFQNALYINIDDPWNAVIFDREWLAATLQALGLGVVRVEPPTVRGFQWVLHIRRLTCGEPIVSLPEDNAPFQRMPPPSGIVNPSAIGR